MRWWLLLACLLLARTDACRDEMASYVNKSITTLNLTSAELSRATVESELDCSDACCLLENCQMALFSPTLDDSENCVFYECGSRCTEVESNDTVLIVRKHKEGNKLVDRKLYLITRLIFHILKDKLSILEKIILGSSTKEIASPPKESKT